MLNLETVIASNTCQSCYDFHNQLLHQTSVESVQEDLELRIDHIKTDIMKLECAKWDFDEQMHTELAINKAAISVASEIVVKGQFCCPQFTTNLSVPFQNPLQTLSLHGGSLANSPGNYIHTLLLPVGVARLASSPGHSQILSHSRGEKSGEGLVPLYVTDRKWYITY